MAVKALRLLFWTFVFLVLMLIAGRASTPSTPLQVAEAAPPPPRSVSLVHAAEQRRHERILFTIAS